MTNDEERLLIIIRCGLRNALDLLMQIKGTGELYKLNERTRLKFKQIQYELEMTEEWLERQIKSSS